MQVPHTPASSVIDLLLEKLPALLADSHTASDGLHLQDVLADSQTTSDGLQGVLDALSNALRRRYWNKELREDAALSACRSLIRRHRLGVYLDEDPERLAGILLDIAAEKARRDASIARRERPGLIEDREARGRTALEEDVLAEEDELMNKVALQMIERIRALLKKPGHRHIFDYFLKKQRGTECPTQQEIADQVGYTVRTVGRVWKRCENLWTKWVEDARHILAEMDANLD